MSRVLNKEEVGCVETEMNNIMERKSPHAFIWANDAQNLVMTIRDREEKIERAISILKMIPCSCETNVCPACQERTKLIKDVENDK